MAAESTGALRVTRGTGLPVADREHARAAWAYIQRHAAEGAAAV